MIYFLIPYFTIGLAIAFALGGNEYKMSLGGWLHWTFLWGFDLIVVVLKKILKSIKI